MSPSLVPRHVHSTDRPFPSSQLRGWGLGTRLEDLMQPCQYSASIVGFYNGCHMTFYHVTLASDRTCDVIIIFGGQN